MLPWQNRYCLGVPLIFDSTYFAVFSVLTRSQPPLEDI